MQSSVLNSTVVLATHTWPQRSSLRLCNSQAHSSRLGTLREKPFLSFHQLRRLISQRSGEVISQRKSCSSHSKISRYTVCKQEMSATFSTLHPNSGTPNSGTVQLVLSRPLLQSLDLHQTWKESLDEGSWAGERLGSR